MTSAAVLAALAFMPASITPSHQPIFPEGAVLEELCTGMTWTEGPVWMPGGFLLFADIPGNSIRKWQGTAGHCETYLHPSGYEPPSEFRGKEPGSNGMTIDTRGRLTIAGHGRRNVWRIETADPHGQTTVLADRYQGKRLNSPNDLVYKSDGSLYFTDPPYGLESQEDTDPKKELKFNGVYRIAKASALPAGAKPPEPELLIDNLTRPNGIAFSPDEKQLYVSVSDPKHKVWMIYDVDPAGKPVHGRVFYDCTAEPATGSPDGIKVDTQGHLYGSGPGGVWVFLPSGKRLATLSVPQPVANLGWGDDGYLYITASSSVYRIKTLIPGVRPGPTH